MKYITFAVPSYNSQDYLERCIDSLLPGGDDVEIIIVNDGSTDNTAKIADRYALAYPNIVRVIHKENGGHGSGVNAGIENATGLYFKVVDSDDWVDRHAYFKLLNKIKESVNLNKEPVDLYITNYVYNRLNQGLKHEVHFKNVFPIDKVCSWNDIRFFTVSQYLMMHALTYKTEVVRESGVKLPEHTFYVDNIFAYQPLPYVKNLVYLDAPLYQYYIGREDQSVNEKSMVRRIDQQFRVTKAVIDCHDLSKLRKENPKLAKYMARKISILMCITSILCSLANTDEAKNERTKLWARIKAKDKSLYNQVKFSSLNAVTVLPEAISDPVSVSGYRVAKKIYMFA